MKDHGVWFAPGRANLMGEHTDYNDGFVLPFALEQGATVAASGRGGAMIALTSRQRPGPEIVLDVSTLVPGDVKGWAAYLAGVAWALREAGYEVPGASIAIDSDVPVGSGLSSSAALECAAALALTSLAGLDVPRSDLVMIARRAENDFVGAPTGIMDQSASLLCTAGHALLLDCLSQESRQVPLDAQMLIINTRAKHEHSGGDYGARRFECEEAARALAVPSLRSITDCGDVARLADPVLRRRARHVCTDDQRVLRTVDLLRDGRLAEVGKLLTAAHVSLRDDFEVSWPQADVAVEAALSAGALGARMIGGGFGGSVLALLPGGTGAAAPPAPDAPDAAAPPPPAPDAAALIRDAVAAAYAARDWAAPGFYDAVPSAGARRVG